MYTVNRVVDHLWTVEFPIEGFIDIKDLSTYGDVVHVKEILRGSYKV